MQNFVERELTARVSIGPKNPDEGRRFDFSDPKRVHISVQGSRQFFPKDWKHLPYDTDHGRKKDHLSVTSVVEQVNVSFRWVDGKLEDWNDMEQWIKEAGSTSLAAKGFNPNRTTYCVDYTTRISQKQSTEPETKENVMRLVRRFGRKDGIIPLSPSIYAFDRRSYDHANDALKRIFDRGVQGCIPIIGYDHVGNRAELDLKQFYQSDIAAMSTLEGVDYMFSKVLPVVEKFVAK